MSAGKHAELCKNPHARRDDKCYYQGGRKKIRALQPCLAGQSGTPSDNCSCKGPAHQNAGRVSGPPQITDPISLGGGYFLRRTDLLMHPHHKQSFFPSPAQITEPQDRRTAKPTQLIHILCQFCFFFPSESWTLAHLVRYRNSSAHWSPLKEAILTSLHKLLFAGLVSVSVSPLGLQKAWRHCVMPPLQHHSTYRLSAPATSHLQAKRDPAALPPSFTQATDGFYTPTLINKTKLKGRWNNPFKSLGVLLLLQQCFLSVQPQTLFWFLLLSIKWAPAFECFYRAGSRHDHAKRLTKTLLDRHLCLKFCSCQGSVDGSASAALFKISNS